MPEKPDPAALVPMNLFEQDYPVRVNLVYAQADHPDNHFGQLYHPEAKILWLHKGLAKIVLKASLIANQRFGWRLQLLDGLRPVEAQERMSKFGYEEIYVAPPTRGGHPRAMAIDILPIDKNGTIIDMGSRFDEFSEKSARNYPHDQNIIDNREKLTTAMIEAGKAYQQEVWPLSSEWWDFRIPKPVSDQFAPLYEADLYPFQRLITPDIKAAENILSGKIPDEIRQSMDEMRAG